MTEVFIGFGSNMGDRQAYLNSAVGLLAQECEIIQVSSIFETEPEGFTDQPDFLNCVVKGETGLRPRELLDELKSIEKTMGRKPSFRNAPRPIDLDIIFYGDEIVKEAGLEIPHPRLQERAFVLVPMAQIAPQFTHPTLHKTMQQLLSEMMKGQRVEKWGELALDLRRS
ncbi:MAG: 2-amino-4-hydroxy-6-hydroxymethyldihydropteridine diphosphokinase [Dehalococcoidia bacterium]